jgi:hypothetical protein
MGLGLTKEAVAKLHTAFSGHMVLGKWDDLPRESVMHGGTGHARYGSQGPHGGRNERGFCRKQGRDCEIHRLSQHSIDSARSQEKRPRARGMTKTSAFSPATPFLSSPFI